MVTTTAFKPADSIRRAWHAWVGVASHVGDFQARVLLTLFYYLIAPLFALVARARDPLGIGKPSGQTAWQSRPAPTETVAQARRQF